MCKHIWNWCKEVVPRQEVTIRKETEQDVVNLEGTVRRERPDVLRRGDAGVEVTDETP
ncbi:MAG: DUF2382 domain-containing protein [Cyanobacteria bacterium P01_A01_bin.135]